MAAFGKSAARVNADTFDTAAGLAVGESVTVDLPGFSVRGQIDSRLEQEGMRHFGLTLEDGFGRLVVSLREDGSILGDLFFNGENGAFEIRPGAGEGTWEMRHTTVDRILCCPPGSIYPLAQGMPKTPDPEPEPGGGPEHSPDLEAALPLLQSLPGAAHVIYLDFDGEVVTHPWWNGGATINALPHPKADNAVFVTNVWRRTSEDFSPFAINVTTSRAVFDATSSSKRVHCIVTPTATAYPGSGGVAYLGSFGMGIPCWTFNQDEYSCAETNSHEVGHTLDLAHDGVAGGDGYYGGHGSGRVSWAPIMGASWNLASPTYYDEVTQWSQGEYTSANNGQDDLAIITSSRWGFGYKPDDKGDTRPSASTLGLSGSDIYDAGIIERSTDNDLFVFSTTGGPVLVNVSPININSPEASQAGANLAVSLQLQDFAGNTLQSSNPADVLGASVSAYLTAGTYYLKVDGAARGTGITGFTDYASIGLYTISGSIIQSVGSVLTISPTTQPVIAAGAEHAFQVISDTAWSWSDNASWVTSSEGTSQNGNQTFNYTVAANTTPNARVAVITLTAGSLTATHTITQAGVPVPDDHGDSTATATLVSQNSSTSGNIGAPGDNDFFRINVLDPGVLTLSSTGNSDPFGYLLNAAGSELIFDDDAGPDYNFLMSYTVTPGTYYVRVRQYGPEQTGTYQLVSSLTPSSTLVVNPVSRTVGAGASSQSFQVTSNTTWGWSISSGASWISTSEVASQTGNQTFSCDISPNTTAGSRTATITFGTGSLVATHVITQESPPDIAVEDPAGTSLASGGSASVGTILAGTSSPSRTFTIRNTGTTSLTGISVALEGLDAGSFTLNTGGMAGTLAGGASTTFTVVFSPTVTGPRVAGLRIVSNDPDENPFTIGLTGEGITPGQIAQQAYAKGSNAGAGDELGYSVAVSGDTVVVGARYEDSNATTINGDQANNGATDAGAAYVLTRSGSTWSQQAYLKGSNTGAGDRFGWSVAITGDTIVVGAIEEDSSATGVNGDGSNNSASNAGAAYVFTRSGSVWTQQAYLKASNAGAGDSFGSAVAVSGDTVLVGARAEDSSATGPGGSQSNNSSTDSGAAYVFVRTGTTWTQQAYLKASNTDDTDDFGFTLSLSGDTAAVGASGEDSDATGVNGNQSDEDSGDSGAVYIFTRSTGSWTQQAYLKASNTGAGDRFGRTVSISGNTVAVGARFEDSNATGVNGSQSNNSAASAGAAYVFTRTGTTWSQQAYLKASNTGAEDEFGFAVDVSGDKLVVGARYEESNATGVNGDQGNNGANEAGAAYVFARSGTTWTQHAYLKASNSAASDNFGWSVGISGGLVVAGAPGEDSATTGINGDGSSNSAVDAGAAYVFDLWPAFGRPEIAVEQPLATDIPSGSTSGFGTALVGTPGLPRAFTIRNAGSADLTGIAVSLDGPDAGDFSLTVGTANTLAGGATMPFSVSFRPSGTGPHVASLRITSNDLDENPFVINLTGEGITAGEIAQQAYAKASNAGGGDEYGYSVAVSGDTVVIGARHEDSNATGINGTQSNNSATEAGAVYVLTRTGSNWTQQAYLKGGNTGAGDRFGWAVAISGDTLAVGAIEEDSNATGVNGDGGNNSSSNAGAAYVFTRSGGTWSQQAYLKASNTGAGDNFGGAVSVSGDTLLVGARFEDSSATGINGSQGSGADESGAAYVFTRTSGVWSQQAYLKASNTGAGDDFGFTLSLSGDTAVVGASGEDSDATGVMGNQADNDAGESGAAYVFIREAGVWSQQSYLKPSNTGAGDRFGRTVSVSGNTVAVGARFEDGGSTGVNGNASSNSATDSGAAYVFARSGTTWSQQAYVKASNTGSGDEFGFAVEVSGDKLVVGARHEESNATGVNGDQANNGADESGAAYLFTRSGNDWSQRAYLKASNTGAGDTFGWSVGISGGLVVVGAPSEDSASTGINGDGSSNAAVDSGAAYTFDLGDTASGLPLDVAIDQPSILVSNSGNAFWTGQTATTHDGIDAGESGFISHLQSSSFSIPASGPGIVGFCWKVSSEVGYDFLTVAIDGVVQPGGISGEVGWQRKAYDLTAGEHTVTWTYSKDVSVHVGQDRAWLDQVVLLSSTTDTDSDSLNDAAEYKLAGLGFDPALAQPDLVSALFEGASGAGLYTASQVQALHTGTPLISRNPATGKFSLTMDWKKSTTLNSFADFPVQASDLSVTPGGDIKLEFTSPDNAAFFRVESR